MHDERITPSALFAPEWPSGRICTPEREIARLDYLAMHAPDSREWLPASTQTACRIICWDAENLSDPDAETVPERFAAPDESRWDHLWSVAHVVKQFDNAGGQIPAIWRCDCPAGYANPLTGDCTRCGA